MTAETSLRRPLLYTYRRCPYAMRARMALLQTGIGFDAHEIVLRNKPAQMIALSPKGTVPVLLLPGGEVIDQSLDVMQWAFARRDPDGWWARAQSQACRSLVEVNDGTFKQHLDRYKYPERHPQPGGASAAREAALACLLQPLETQLQGQPFLGGERPCAADLAIFPFVRQFRAVDESWFDAQGLHASAAWLHGWVRSEMFGRCMKKLDVDVVQRFG